jgi:transposase
MSKQVLYIGVDVGCTELWAALEGCKPRRFKHTTSGIRSLYTWGRQKGDDRPLCFCMEATGVYSVSVARRLVDLPNTTVGIVNPMQIAAFAKAQLRRSKTDQIDAEVIRTFAETQKPKAWSPDPKPLRQLYQLVSQADAVRSSLAQWHNRHHAQKFIADLPDAVKKSQRNIERSMKRQLEQIEQAITGMCAADTCLAQKIALLCTIPGIAETSAVKLIAYGRTWLTERKPKELIAHAGLAPHHKRSGTSVKGKSRIDKHGDHRLRKTLYMPALVGAHHNQILKQFYQRLLNDGKPKMVALVACMKKLLLIVRAILITKKPFSTEYQPLT